MLTKQKEQLDRGQLVMIRKRKTPKAWVRAAGIWPDKIDPIKYQRKLRKEYGH